jgi:hypothetical protein
MTNEYDKKQWQDQILAKDIEAEKLKAKLEKARKRSAHKAKSKLSRLHKDLSDLGELSDFEDEFGESVLDRLDKFGSAFYNSEKGNLSDALSFAQKRVLSAMTKKVKNLKNPKLVTDEMISSRKRSNKKYSSFSTFKTKAGSKKPYKPNVRDLYEDMPIEESKPSETYIPEYSPSSNKPFLRIVGNTD